jgi:hypothetical protein
LHLAAGRGAAKRLIFRLEGPGTTALAGCEGKSLKDLMFVWAVNETLGDWEDEGNEATRATRQQGSIGVSPVNNATR